MRSDPPGPAHDLARLKQVHRKRDALDAEWLALCKRLREYDPPVPWARIGQAAGGMTDGGVINAVRRAEMKAAAEAAQARTQSEAAPSALVAEHGTA